ncbi:MAG: PilZ domain-containing protein [Myxococcales bacterium]|jgi:c-di-GMP-binding flagellar brake protein YcgR|nr:PilZ domain-containing protein [Myxococcales bacterium]
MTRRRAHERYQCEISVRLVHEGRELHAVSENLSLGGMLLRSDVSLPLAAEVKVQFDVPSSGITVETDAVVRWHKPSGFGVQFMSLRAREVWALNRWFTKLSAVEQSI